MDPIPYAPCIFFTYIPPKFMANVGKFVSCFASVRCLQMSPKVTMMGSYSMKIRAESCKNVDHGVAVFSFWDAQFGKGTPLKTNEYPP